VARNRGSPCATKKPRPASAVNPYRENINSNALPEPCLSVLVAFPVDVGDSESG